MNKYMKPIRIPAGSPTDGIKLTNELNQHEMCGRFNVIGQCRCRDIRCNACVFHESNRYYWKLWKEENFMGVKNK